MLNGASIESTEFKISWQKPWAQWQNAVQPVILFQPIHWLRHPETCLFILLKYCLLDQSILKKSIYIYIPKKVYISKYISSVIVLKTTSLFPMFLVGSDGPLVICWTSIYFRRSCSVYCFSSIIMQVNPEISYFDFEKNFVVVLRVQCEEFFAWERKQQYKGGSQCDGASGADATCKSCLLLSNRCVGGR